MSNFYLIQSAGETRRISESQFEKAIARALEISAATSMEVEVVRVLAIVRPPKVEVFGDEAGHGIKK